MNYYSLNYLQNTTTPDGSSSLNDFYQFIAQNIHPVVQALLATTFNWLTTTLGAAIVLFCCKMPDHVRVRLLHVMYGVGAGVMLAASMFGLLNPSLTLGIEAMGGNRRLAIIPFAIPCLFGCLSLLVFDVVLHQVPWKKFIKRKRVQQNVMVESTERKLEDMDDNEEDDNHVTAHRDRQPDLQMEQEEEMDQEEIVEQHLSWKRIILLVTAVTLHNLPEGLVVGVSFAAAANGAIPIASAISLTLGVGIQNIPEGMAIALPMQKEGVSAWKCFLLGSASGLMEPVGGLIGVILVYLSNRVLPYALSFAGGAMVFVVISELIPEMTKAPKQKAKQSKEHVEEQDSLFKRKSVLHTLANKSGLFGFIFGFIVMMSLECLL